MHQLMANYFSERDDDDRTAMDEIIKANEFQGNLKTLYLNCFVVNTTNNLILPCVTNI